MRCDCGCDFEPVIEYRHRVLCGDCTNPDDVQRLLGDLTPTFVFADPPYGVNIVATNEPSWWR